MTPREKTAWAKLNQRKLKGETYLLLLSSYDNGRAAIEVMNVECHEPECRLTVNLVDDPLEEFEFHVRFEVVNYAGDVIEALKAEGIAVPTGKIVSAGYVAEYAEVWRLVTEPVDERNTSE